MVVANLFQGLERGDEELRVSFLKNGLSKGGWPQLAKELRMYILFAELDYGR